MSLLSFLRNILEKMNMNIKMNMKKHQAGFTLIELVLVIVLVGVLAAVALPKFVDLGSDARISAIKGVDGAMRSANAVIYAKAAVSNSMGASSSVSVGGVSIDTAYGFAKDATELAKAMDLSTDFLTVAADISHTGATDAAACKNVYTPVGGQGSVPVYVMTLTGC